MAAAMMAAAGCGGGASDTGGTNSSPVEHVVSGFVASDVGHDITTTGTTHPRKADIITPAGTVTINEVDAVERLTAQQARELGAIAPSNADDAGEDLPVGPADGEVFRLIDLTFAPDDAARRGATPVPTTSLFTRINGSRQHLADLGAKQEYRVLVSVPEDHSAQLVAAAGGHDQFADLLTGERQDDRVAAAYYLPDRDQDVYRPFRIPSATFHTRDATGSPGGSITTDFTVRVESAELSAWTPDGGWAEPGKAWLAIRWSHALGLENDTGVLSQIDDLTAALSIDAHGATSKVSIHQDDASGVANEVEKDTYLAVPLDTRRVTLGFDGHVAVSCPNGSGLTVSGTSSAEFHADKIEISFAG